MVIFMDRPSDEEIHAFENSVLKKAYRFTGQALIIREALQGPSVFNHSGQKVLAMSGRAALDLYFADQGRKRNKAPGEIDVVLQAVASNDSLYKRGIALGIDPFIVKNPGQYGMTAGKKAMSTTMEAIVGAVYYDCDKNGDVLERVLTALGLAWPE